MIRFKLDELLASRKMTKYQLIKISGVRPNTLTQWTHENGVDVRSITVETLDTICRALNCRVEDLIEYVPDNNEKTASQ